jgi:hypothetical protein
MGGGWSGLERLLAEFRCGGRKTFKTGFWGLIREATHCATGIYILSSPPANLQRRTAVRVRRTRATHCEHITCETNLTHLTLSAYVLAIPVR